MPVDRNTRRGWCLDACVIYALAVALIYPLFGVRYLDNWQSIEATFIADGRLLRENWPHHLWQPLWYLGTRADYVYPPGLRYGVALLSWMLHSTAPRVYHIFIALFYAFGIVAVYLWVRTAVTSRGAAWLAAAAAALVSPCFLIAPYLIDSTFLVPWRLHVLLKYGEGPHISSLGLLPIVWLGAWRRFRGGGIRWLLLSATAAALVVTLNFYGATSLAITFSILMWACFVERPDWRILRDSMVIAGLAYGLTAWWLVPSYVQVTLRNLHLVEPQSHDRSIWILALIAVVYVAATFGLRRRMALPAYPLFAFTGLLFLTFYVFGFRWFGFQVAGDSQRLTPEWDLFAILCGVAAATQAWKWRPAGRLRWMPRNGVVLLLLACFLPSWLYLTNAYTEFQADRHWQNRVEVRTSDWLWRNFPDQRIFATGSIRFWDDVWNDGQQADGGSQQGILNSLIPAAIFGVPRNNNPALVLSLLRMMAVDIVVVPGASSQEPYKDFTNSSLWDRYCSLVHDDGAGNRFYRVPRRMPGIVQVVDRNKLEAAPRIPEENFQSQMSAYAEVIEAAPPGGDAPDRIRSHWRGSDELDIDAALQSGETLLVHESFDPYWRAYVDSKPQAIRRDAAGLMAIDLTPGNHSVRLLFETPAEDSVGRSITFATLVLMVFLGLYGKPGQR